MAVLKTVTAPFDGSPDSPSPSMRMASLKPLPVPTPLSPLSPPLVLTAVEEVRRTPGDGDHFTDI